MKIEAKYSESDTGDRVFVNYINSKVVILIDGVKFVHEFPIMSSHHGLTENERRVLETRREWSRKLVNKLNGVEI